MDLGLGGRRALVCAASKGLGRACAESLSGEGVLVTITARNEQTLSETARQIEDSTGTPVTIAAGDITSEEGRAAALSVCPNPDILINNAGGPPTGNFRNWERDDWIAAIDGNMLTPIFLIKSVIDGMIERKFGRIVNITSAAVKSPIPALGLSNGARAGLTGFVAGLSRQVAGTNVTINNILPGPFETDRLKQNIAAGAKAEGRDAADVRAARIAANPSKRFGQPSEFGDACAFLCASQAGYITGQNILLDGGAFNSTF